MTAGTLVAFVSKVVGRKSMTHVDTMGLSDQGEGMDPVKCSPATKEQSARVPADIICNRQED